MEFQRVVRRRRMTRRFAADRPVERADLDLLLDLGGRGPSAGFSQGGEYVVLVEPADRAAFWAAATPATPAVEDVGGAAPAVGADAGASPGLGRDEARRAWLAGVRAAPVLILVLADEGAYRRRYAAADKGGTPPDRQAWPVPYWLTDRAMGAMLILLGATDLGLGALFFGVPGARHGAVARAFAIPPDRVLLGVIAVGHEARRVGGSARHRRRRPPAEFTHWGAYGVARPGPDPRVGDNAGQTDTAP